MKHALVERTFNFGDIVHHWFLLGNYFVLSSDSQWTNVMTDNDVVMGFPTNALEIAHEG